MRIFSGPAHWLERARLALLKDYTIVKVVSSNHVPWRSDTPKRESYMMDASQVEASLKNLAEKYPSMARVLDIGDSARKVRGQSGHDLTALVIGSNPDDDQTPRILIAAGVHPRETANPAALIEWASRTLAAADRGDTARQSLLATRTIALVPLVNPDTADTVLAGLDAQHTPDIWWRGNDGDHGAVDLNRNFDNRWGAGSSDPMNQNFRGPGPASEPEVKSIQNFARMLRPAAVYDIHSPGSVVLMPTGAPDALAAAKLVSRATGYDVSTSDLHWQKPVGGGTLKNWAHDQLGAVSLTIETGLVHHQNLSQYLETTERLFPAIDALVATVDGTQAPPSAAEALATPDPPPIPPRHAEGHQDQSRA